MTIFRLAGVAILVTTVAAVVCLSRSSADKPTASSSPATTSSPWQGVHGNVSSQSPRLESSGSTTIADPTLTVMEPSPITVTTRAVATLKSIAAQDGTLLWWLRVRVLPGGCSGFQHKLDLDNATGLADATFVSSGIRVVVFKRQIEMLRGAQVDYLDENGKQGFDITNPNFEGEALKRWLPILTADALSAAAGH